MKIDSSISNYYFAQGRHSKDGANAHNEVADQPAQRRSAISVAPATSSTSLSKALWLLTENVAPAISGSVAETASGSSAIDEFLEWSQMTLPEKIRAQYLEEHNLTEESLQAMPLDERQKIEEEIRKAIFEQLRIEERNAEKAASNSEAASN